MAPRHFLTINLNEQCAIDAGSCQECVAEGQSPSRLISPPHTTMYRQVLSYVEETTRDEKVPPKSQLHFGEVAIATVAICLRWGSYFAVLTNHDLPQWTAAFDPEASCISDGEMARINSVNGRRSLMETLARDFGSQWLEREEARVLVHPTRALANGILNQHWRNGSGIEDAHAGGVAPPRPLTQRRLTKRQEALLMQETAELFVPTMRAVYAVARKPSEESWPEKVLPYAMAFKPPANWSLHEQTREITLPGAEPQ